MHYNITEILTVVLVIATIYYAWQTRKTVQVMQDANETNSRPVLSVSVVNDRAEGASFVDLIIANTGNGLARKVKFKSEGDELEVYSIGKHKRLLQEIDIVKNGIDTFAPHEVKRIWLLSSIGRVDEVISKNVKIIVSYKNFNLTKTYEDKFSLDFASLTRIQLGHDSLYNIDKEIKKIRELMEKKK